MNYLSHASVAGAGASRRHALTGGLRGAVVVALIVALTGCATEEGTAVEEPMTSTSAASPSPSSPQAGGEADWPAVDEMGTGPTTLTIPRPSPDAFYLMASFSCTVGEGMVELQEDTRVFMSGPCGGSSNYQMPLPAGVTELHFTIDVEEGSEFTFSGTFMPRG